ncbi:hypothetical protein OIU84_004269 [Salix udensis]|uniref:Myb-like domain-containing protein n=1 Tax=Salix udensis TaxID=889485 RepID=A0AAD6P463_9ROSI|nr:hypothetical protein OIU84_004269 [Salix udensis]
MRFRSGGGEGGAGLGPINMMPTEAMLSPKAEISPRGPPLLQPQWGLRETKEFIGVRAELKKDFTVTKRNRTLWEMVSARMGEKGYRRTPEQCKCKWKNLTNLYKGKETPDPETGRQCLFFEELHEVFTGRAKNGQRVLLESEAGSTRSRKKARRIDGDRSSDEFSDEDEVESEEEKPAGSNSRKRKGGKTVAEKTPRASGSAAGGGVQEMLKDFFQQQLVMEMQWRELMEKRAHERQMSEQEWRRSMDKLERERLTIEQAWREREEQRRIRGESRAERRDALLTTLLNKLIGENDHM